MVKWTSAAVEKEVRDEKIMELNVVLCSTDLNLLGITFRTFKKVESD